MNDNDIIKIIKHCINKTCVGCKREDNNCHSSDSCRYDLLKVALDLINRQKAEIERLQKEKDFEKYEKTRLRLLFKGEYDNNKKAKSEAIKEFAERLKEEATVDDDSTWWVANIDIDNLVKEMTEGKE